MKIDLLSFAVAGLFLALPSVAETTPEWPGLPPQCWPESRNVHGGSEGEQWQKNVRITQIRAEKPKGGEFSPNKGYFFVRQGDWPTARLLIYAEQEMPTQIEFNGLSGLGSVNWINEKLLFFRVWWTPTTGNDVIFDVESGSVIYSEQFWDGSLARRQALDSCRQGGCECTPEAAPR